MKEFQKKYDRNIEANYYKILSPKDTSKKLKKTTKKESASQTFSLCLPPPNVTGVLHLGHALTITVEDALARYHVLQGHDVVYIPGTDHAGISTQVKVEEKIAQR